MKSYTITASILLFTIVGLSGCTSIPGAAGGAGTGDVANDKGYTIHFITDAGVSATATAGIIRVSPIKLKP